MAKICIEGKQTIMFVNVVVVYVCTDGKPFHAIVFI